MPNIDKGYGCMNIVWFNLNMFSRKFLKTFYAFTSVLTQELIRL